MKTLDWSVETLDRECNSIGLRIHLNITSEMRAKHNNNKRKVLNQLLRTSIKLDSIVSFVTRHKV